VASHPPAERGFLKDNELAHRLQRRRNEIRVATLGNCPDERGTATRSLAGQDVGLRVPDHPGVPEVNVELACEPKDHSGARLPAAALRALVMRAVAERLDGAAVLSEIALDDDLERAQDGSIKDPKGDSALV
jgi:hypothetical protein